MNYQTYDLRDLDEHTRQLIVQGEVDKMLDGEFCTICDGAFIGRKEKDNAIVSRTGPLKYAHEFCWSEIDNTADL